MAKIAHFICEYKEQIRMTGIEPRKEASATKIVIQRFVRLFKTIEDTRVQNMIAYPLVELILITFLAVFANSSTWQEIEAFGQENHKWLKKFLKLKNGIPSHDTFRRVFALIDPIQFEQATVAFLLENLFSIKKALGHIPKETSYRQICVDGKEERGSGRKYGTTEEITNLTDIELCADAIRGHWGVENKLHWQLDFSFGEDYNTTMDKKAFLNLSIINKMVLNLCTLAKPLFKNSSIQIIRKKIGWNFNNLSLILNSFDEETIKNTLENTKKK